jgi:hypothetical protein
LHNDLVPWAELTDDRRAIDRAAVKAWPKILAHAGYRIIDDPARLPAARMLYEHYAAHKEATEEAPVALPPWERLSSAERDRNFSHIDDLPYKLHAIGRRLAVNATAQPPLVLASEEIERLAEAEHARWRAERVREGWKLGPEDLDKHHPDLVPWGELPEDRKEYDRVLVRAISDILVATGLTAVPTDTGVRPGQA